MPKLTLKQVRLVGDAFIEYLEKKKLLTAGIISKPKLKEIYENEFRNEVTGIGRSCFSTMLYSLCYKKPQKLVVKNGYIRIKDNSGNNNGNNQSKTGQNNERRIIFREIHRLKKRDAFLKSAYIQLSVEPLELENANNFGYVECDLKDRKQFKIQIENTSGTDLHLKKCLYLRHSSYLLLNDHFGCTSEKTSPAILMKPNSVYDVTLTCSANDNLQQQVGSYTGDLFFHFLHVETNTTFFLLRYIRFFKSDEMVELLKPTAPYKPRKVPVEDFQDIEILEGVKVKNDKSRDKLVLTRDLPHFAVPHGVISAFKQGVFQSPDDNRQVPPSTPSERQLLKLLSSDLDINNYAMKYSLLINIEEKQAEIDIRSYDLLSRSLVPRDRTLFSLKIPGLAERRPSVLKGDRIYLRRVDQPTYGMRQVEYEGYVHKITRDCAELQFHRDFNSSYHDAMKFNVRFTVNRLPIKLQQRAVKSLATGPMKDLLFPNHVGDQILPVQRLVAYNRKVEENARQALAVQAIMHGSAKAPYIIYGPPGTGKTMTVVEVVKQVVLKQNKRVLVCAPSNSACDLMVQRLSVEGKFHGHIHGRDIFRMNAFSRPWSDVPEDIKTVSNHTGGKNSCYFSIAKEELLRYKVVATTLVTAGRLSSAEVDPFDLVVIDEAGHSVEPELLIALDGLLGKEGRLVLAGDPKQLGPILRSYAAKEYGLEMSYMERLMEYIDIYQPDDQGEYDHRVITKLLNNYRSHEAILKISNECFYDNELKICADEVLMDQFCQWEHLPKRDFPVIFHGVKGNDEREADSPSYFNAEEATVVHDYMIKILETRRNPVKPDQIGIISPYRKQVQKLRELLMSKKKKLIPIKEIKIGSVEEFQGQERRVIIISTVRSNTKHLVEDERFNLGFLNNPKRFNVAVTRAMNLLIVVGNPEILCRDYYWNRLITFCCDNGAYRGFPFTPSAEPTGNDDGVDDVTRQMRTIGLDGLVSDLQSHVEPPHVDRI